MSSLFSSRPRAPKQRIGAAGEAAAAAELEAAGCEILDRNYRCPYGEVDLVARDGDVIVFVEVKTRSSLAFGLPRDAVTPAKRRKMARTASHYLLTRVQQDCPYRADIIEVAVLNGRIAAVRHLRGAFSIEAELEKL
jgi:putative endonuclease